MNASAHGIVGLLILTPIAILVIVVLGAIKFSDRCPGRWTLLQNWQDRRTSHNRLSSGTSSDSTNTDPSVDLENGLRTESK